jgi:hypothetical protein
MLPCANSIIGTEPTMADAAGTLPGNGHDDPSSPSRQQILSCNFDYRAGGSILESIPGSLLESAEDLHSGCGLFHLNRAWKKNVVLQVNVLV